MTQVQTVISSQYDVVAVEGDLGMVRLSRSDVDVFESPVAARCDFTA